MDRQLQMNHTSGRPAVACARRSSAFLKRGTPLSHTLKEARRILDETAAIMEKDRAKKVNARAAGKKKPVAAKPPTWPQAIAVLAEKNGWSRAKAAAELERLPGGRQLREQYARDASAIAQKQREVIRLQGRQSAARGRARAC